MYTILGDVTPSSFPFSSHTPQAAWTVSPKACGEGLEPEHCWNRTLLKQNTAEANHVQKQKERKEQEEKLEQSLQVQNHRILSGEGRPGSNHNICLTL